MTSRLAAEDWYEAQVAAADKRRRTTRRERKIARLILGRIGRQRMPRVDKIALRARLGEFRAHERWLRHRIDPAWVGVLDQRLRRRETRALVFFGLFLAALLANGARVYIVDASNGELSIALLLAGPLGAAFLLWILKLIVTELVRLVRPSLSVPSGAALGRLRGLFQRRSTRQPRDVDR